MYVIGFNGPPRCGKDTAMAMLTGIIESSSSIPTLIRPLSMPMRLRAFGALGLKYSDSLYEQLKDKPMSVLQDNTLRRFMIDDSERFMKPTYGQDIWCKLVVESIPKTFDGVVLIPDFGFSHEPKFFEKKYGLANVVTAQIERPEKSFTNDSRTWVHGVNRKSLVNDSTLDQLYLRTQILHQSLLDLGWKI